MNEITVKLLKVMKHIFRNTTYFKAIRLRFRHAISIISMASKMAEADEGPLEHELGCGAISKHCFT